MVNDKPAEIKSITVRDKIIYIEGIKILNTELSFLDECFQGGWENAGDPMTINIKNILEDRVKIKISALCGYKKDLNTGKISFEVPYLVALYLSLYYLKLPQRHKVMNL